MHEAGRNRPSHAPHCEALSGIVLAHEEIETVRRVVRGPGRGRQAVQEGIPPKAVRLLSLLGRDTAVRSPARSGPGAKSGRPLRQRREGLARWRALDDLLRSLHSVARRRCARSAVRSAARGRSRGACRLRSLGLLALPRLLLVLGLLLSLLLPLLRSVEERGDRALPLAALAELRLRKGGEKERVSASVFLSCSLDKTGIRLVTRLLIHPCASAALSYTARLLVTATLPRGRAGAYRIDCPVAFSEL